MTFEQWINRPVYKAQCFTASILRDLYGLPNGDIATRGDDTGHPLNYFRVVHAYRCAKSREIRKRVAKAAIELRATYRQARKVRKMHGCDVGIWRDGSLYYVRAYPQRDSEAQRNGWELFHTT